jgi:hypothetical protein
MFLVSVTANIGANSEKAAFLGDSDFPNSILPYYRGGRIILFQDLFRTYSGLKFSRAWDRSIAMAGLERRLMTALKTKAGYGIFEAYLERSLLWVRSKVGTLVPINYASDRSVPSWSWMTYEGPISYVEAPFDQIDWTKDYESPFKSDEGQSFWEANGNYPPPALVCKKARKLSPSSFHDLVLQDAIVLDLPSRVHEIDQLRCVILGTQKVGRPGESRRHYAMVLAPSSSRHSGAYSRVGVGVVKDSDVCWGPEEEVEIY